jgi:hypothetical protein
VAFCGCDAVASATQNAHRWRAIARVVSV